MNVSLLDVGWTVNLQEQRADSSLESDVRAIALQRDRRAFQRLFAHFSPRLKGYLRKLGVGDDQVEDLVQEVMISIWRRAHQFDPSRAALSTWVYTIARNKRIDVIRKERHPDYDLDDPALEPDEAPRGDTYTEAEQIKRQIEAAVERLPQEQAKLLRIFYFEEKTHSAIAEDLGIPLGTVKSRLRLAIEKLRGMLGGPEE